MASCKEMIFNLLKKEFEMKSQKIFYFIWMIFEVVLLVLVVNLPPSLLKDMATNNFGIEMPSGDPLQMYLGWIALYIGILIMLDRSFPLRDDNLNILLTIVVISFVRSSDLLFLEIFPMIEWEKTGDVLLFLGGLGLLVGLILLVFFYGQIHKLFVFAFEDEEMEEEKEGI